MPEVVVVGSYNQDLAFNTPVFPAPGETRLGTFATGPGGKGFNQAVACNRLDVDTLFIGAVGDDVFAAGLRQFIASEGLAAELQVCPDVSTGAASIVVNDQAQNLIVVALGANNHLSTEHIDAYGEDIGQAQYLVCQVENAMDATAHALGLARDSDTTSILNPAPINEALSGELLQTADIITPNETEFLFLMDHALGKTIPSDFWLAKDADIHKYCCEANVATVVLTLGDKGCFVSHNPSTRDNPRRDTQDYFRVPAIDVVAKDTTGAGDAFNGGLAAGMVKYPKDFGRAIEFANRVAGISTTKPGTAPAMPTIEEIIP